MISTSYSLSFSPVIAERHATKSLIHDDDDDDDDDDGGGGGGGGEAYQNLVCSKVQTSNIYAG